MKYITCLSAAFLLLCTFSIQASVPKKTEHTEYESPKKGKAIIEGMFFFNKATIELNSPDGNLNNAKIYLEKALDIFRKYNEEDYLANTYVKQAGVYFRTHQIERAEVILEEASKLKTTKRTALSIALAQTKLERLKGNRDLALASAVSAEKLARFLGNHHQIKRVQQLIYILQNPTQQMIERD